MRRRHRDSSARDGQTDGRSDKDADSNGHHQRQQTVPSRQLSAERHVRGWRRRRVILRLKDAADGGGRRRRRLGQRRRMAAGLRRYLSIDSALGVAPATDDRRRSTSRGHACRCHARRRRCHALERRTENDYTTVTRMRQFCAVELASSPAFSLHDTSSTVTVRN